MPMDTAIGRARVIQVADPESIKPAEIRQHCVQRGERLLFKTSNSSRLWQRDTFAEEFVHLSLEAAQLLAELGVRLVGVDYLSVGAYGAEGAATHVALLRAGVWIVEGLDLSQVAPGEYELVCLPLKIRAGDGAPARVVVRPLATN